MLGLLLEPAETGPGGLRLDVLIFFSAIMGYLLLAPTKARSFVVTGAAAALICGVLVGRIWHHTSFNVLNEHYILQLQVIIALGVVAGVFARIGFRVFASLLVLSLVLLYVWYRDLHLIAVSALIVSCLMIVLYSHLLFKLSPRQGRHDSSGGASTTGGQLGDQWQAGTGASEGGTSTANGDRGHQPGYPFQDGPIWQGGKDASGGSPSTANGHRGHQARYPFHDEPAQPRKQKAPAWSDREPETLGMTPELGIADLMRQLLITRYLLFLFLFQLIVTLLFLLRILLDSRMFIRSHLSEIGLVTASFCIWSLILILVYRSTIKGSFKALARQS